MRFFTLFLLALAACETGWDIEVSVDTHEVTDRLRPLYVFAVSRDWSLASPDGSEQLFESRPHVADVFFETGEFGCTHDLAIAAWAPKSAPAEPHILRPQPGDYFSMSEVKYVYCGGQIKPTKYELVLSGTPL